MYVNMLKRCFGKHVWFENEELQLQGSTPRTRGVLRCHSGCRKGKMGTGKARYFIPYGILSIYNINLLTYGTYEC